MTADCAGEDHSAIALAFGSSWRNAKEAIVVATTLSFKTCSDDPLPLGPEQAKSVRRLVSSFWAAFFGMLSADNLAWLSRTSTSRSYAMHLLATNPPPGSVPTSDGPHAFILQRQAVAYIEVTIGPGPGQPGDPLLPPNVGQLFVVGSSVATP